MIKVKAAMVSCCMKLNSFIYKISVIPIDGLINSCTDGWINVQMNG